ncbi:MAG: hypothetical protein ACI8UO_000266 [Verrucomicrobiales bacterium]|jgi:uncharacterized protein (DUF885 family)
MNHPKLSPIFLLNLMVALPFLSAAAQTPTDMDANFSKISERFIEDLVRSSPVTATNLGDHRFDHLLDEVDADTRQERLDSARQFLAEIDKIDRQQLLRENLVDLQLVQHRLRRQIWKIEELREWNWNPLIYSGLPGDSIYSLMARDGAPLEERLKNAAARCREFPRFFEQARASLSVELTPPIHAETAVGQNRGILSLIDAVLTPQLGKLPAEARADLEEAISIARKAVDEHQNWLESELLPNAKGEARLSEKLYREKFSLEFFDSYTPEELRARANEQVADLHDQMYEISKGIYAGRHPAHEFPKFPKPDEKRQLIQACLEFAYEDAPDRNGVVEAAEHSLRITTDFIRAKDLITLPEDPVEIIVMPEFRRGVSLAYCDAPGPLEVGEKTYYAVAPPPKNWTDEQVRSHLREYNRRSLHTLTIHEAMPGHFVQLAHANRAPNPLRSILGSGTFIEGWAVYTEWMMCEEGFLADDPLMKLIVLKWYLRDATNALIDQAVHLDGIDEAAAMKLLVGQAFQEEREAAGKFRRAQLTSAQLSTYFAGYMELLEMRAAAEESWGASFDLKTYHDKALSFGSPPTAFVKALLLDLPVELSRDIEIRD